MPECSDSGFSNSSRVRKFLSLTTATLAGQCMMMKTLQSSSNFRLWPSQRANIFQHLILLKLLPVRQSRRNSHSLAFQSQQSQSAQHGDGCTSWTGALAPHNMACIWMAMSTQILLHTEMPLLRDGRNMRSASTCCYVWAECSARLEWSGCD